MAMDYYMVLGLTPAANLPQIKRAFRNLSHQHHLDRAGEESAERFMAIKGAYDTLSDSARRADYERERRRGMSRTRWVTHKPIDLFNNFEQFRPSREMIWDWWERNFSHRHESKSRPVRDLNLEVVLSPDEALRGGMLAIDVPVGQLCDRCEGSGSTGYFTCDACDGHGMFWETRRVDVALSPPVREGAEVAVSLKHLGVQNLVLKLHVRVAQ